MITGMKYTAKYANSSPSIHQSLPTPEAGYCFHCVLDALLLQTNSSNISDLSLEKVSSIICSRVIWGFFNNNH